MKVLVVEDDADMAGFLRVHLPARGFVVDVAGTGMEGITAARTNEYDLLILDLHLPDMTGDSLIASLRASVALPPILMLTVVADASSKARMLNAGADDYLAKPFLFDELIARMRALLRRSGQTVPSAVAIGDLSINLNAQSVSRDGKKIYLTRKEFGLLEYLLRHRGTVVTKAALMEHVWESSSNAYSAALDTHLTNLRRKLCAPDVIETVHGRGYLVG